MADEHNVSGRVGVLENNFLWMKEAVTSIRESTTEMAGYTRQLIKLETESNDTRQALSRAFDAVTNERLDRVKADKDLLDAIKVFSDKLKLVEDEMPSIKLARMAVFSLLALLFLRMFATLWDTVILKSLLIGG